MFESERDGLPRLICIKAAATSKMNTESRYKPPDLFRRSYTMKKIVILTLMLAMISAVFAGCARNAPVQTAADSEKLPPSVGAPADVNIGISMPTKNVEMWDRTGYLMQNELRSKGYAVSLDYASNDAATQQVQIENMLNSGCKILIIAPIDSDYLGSVMDKAKENNVTVISYDRLIMNSDAVSYYVAFDPYMTGVKQGEYIIDKLQLNTNDGPYNIEFVAGDPNDNSARLLLSGAQDVLNPYIDQGKLRVKSGQTDFLEVAASSGAPEAAESRMSAIISANYSDGTTLDAVLCSIDSCALGVAIALENNYNGTRPIITGYGCERENVKNILTGKQSMSMFGDLRTLVSKTVEMADAIIKGENVPVNDTERYDNNASVVPSYLCEPALADKDNYYEILVASGFYSENDLK